MAKSFTEIIKQEPSVGDVHVASALSGDPKKKKRQPFSAFVSGSNKPEVVLPTSTSVNKLINPSLSKPIQSHLFSEVIKAGFKAAGGAKRSYPRQKFRKIYGSGKELPDAVKNKLKGKKRRQWRDVWNSSFANHGDESRAFAEAWSTVKKDYSDVLSGHPIRGVGGRTLAPFDADTLYIPFRHDPAALSYLRADQVPRFLDCVTHPKRLSTLTSFPLDQLVAIKSRVSRDVVMKHLDGLDDIKPPIVVRINGTLYIGDGHDRLCACWLNGDNEAEVRYTDLDPFDDSKPDPKDKYEESEGSRFDLLQGVDGRELACYQDGTLAIPFVYDPAFLAKLRPDQVPKFLDALTHQDKQDEATVSLDSLVAIQNRISANSVAHYVEDPPDDPPVIVKINSVNYIVDGHDRLTAYWLQGRDLVPVVLKDISDPNNLMKEDWSAKVIEIKKLDSAKKQVFGWASIVTKGGLPIIDKQGDIIPIDELENAAYHYVMNSRDSGELHVRKGVGTCIESVVLSKEKQDALGVDLGFEGWFVGFQILDDAVWQLYSSGSFPEFSIGGYAIPKAV